MYRTTIIITYYLLLLFLLIKKTKKKRFRQTSQVGGARRFVWITRAHRVFRPVVVPFSHARRLTSDETCHQHRPAAVNLIYNNTLRVFFFFYHIISIRVSYVHIPYDNDRGRGRRIVNKYKNNGDDDDDGAAVFTYGVFITYFSSSSPPGFFFLFFNHLKSVLFRVRLCLRHRRIS